MDAELGKDRIKIPINTYDLFGYFIPGAIALLCVVSFEFWANSQLNASSVPLTLHLPTLKALTQAARPFFDSQDWVLSAVFLIILSVIAYAAGHIVSSISSFFLDRVLVFKGYGYPYQQLLGLKNPKRSSETGPFYRGVFFWVNAYLLLRYCNTIGNDILLDVLTRMTGWFILVVISMKLFVGHFRSHPIKWIVSHSPQILKNIGNAILVVLIRWLFAGPYDLFARSLSRVIDTRSHFAPEFVAFYKEAFHTIFRLDPDVAETNNYWLSKCFVAYKSPTLDSLLVNWLYLYSYARNLATSFYLAFAYCFFSIFFQSGNFLLLDNAVLFIIPIVFFILSLIMLSRYYYLYFIYYSKFLFRAFYFLNQPKIQEMLSHREKGR